MNLYPKTNDSKQFGFIIQHKMFSESESQKNVFLDKTKAAREERAFEKKRDTSVIIIQARVRGWLSRKNYEQLVL